MRHRVILTGALLFAAVPAGAAESTEHLHVIEHATSDTTAHVGTARDNPGDILAFANDLYDAADQTKIGTDQGFCIRVAVGKSFECVWTASVPGGQITVEGPFLDDGDSVLAVTGGTGKFADVRGEMALHARNAKGTAYDFDYKLQHVAAH